MTTATSFVASWAAIYVKSIFSSSASYKYSLQVNLLKFHKTIGTYFSLWGTSSEADS